MKANYQKGKHVYQHGVDKYPPNEHLKFMQTYTRMLGANVTLQEFYREVMSDINMCDVAVESDVRNSDHGHTESFKFVEPFLHWGKVKEAYRFHDELIRQFIGSDAGMEMKQDLKNKMENAKSHSMSDLATELFQYIPLDKLPFQTFVVDTDNTDFNIAHADNPDDESKVTNILFDVDSKSAENVYIVTVILMSIDDFMSRQFYVLKNGVKLEDQDQFKFIYEDLEKGCKSVRSRLGVMKFQFNTILDYAFTKMFRNLLMYLCAKNAEIEEKATTYTRREPSPKHNFREIRTWEVGYRYGNAVREFKKAEASGTASSSNRGKGGIGVPKRPHMRRAHWHRYWCGPGRTELVILWLDPILVHGGDDSEELPTVSHKVTT